LHAPVSMLSGGERNRLLLARLFARPSNLLVMDEPTNDLDAETLELLEEMVANYAGTLLLVSHDRAFLDNVVTSTLVFEGGGQVNEYVGGYSDWLRQRKVTAPAKARAPVAPVTAVAPISAAAPVPAAAPKARRMSYKEQRELAAMPEKIQRLEAEQLQLQATIADPNLFKDDPARGTAALQSLESLAAELETAYARWDALESQAAV
jgi:ATP-binding cassette subfamily F protein uup